MQLRTTLAAAVFGVLALTTSANAVPLLPGATQVPATIIGTPTGTLVATSGPVNFTGVNSIPGNNTVPFSGVFTTSVINEGAANVLGGLTFVYDFTNNGPNPLRRLTAVDFGGFTVDVNYDGTGPLAGNTPPITFDRSGGTGSIIGFDFTGGLLNQSGVLAGGGSSLLVIRTNATGFTAGGVSLIDGGTASLASFAPNAVPEPGTMAAALVGLVFIGGYRLRRRAR